MPSSMGSMGSASVEVIADLQKLSQGLASAVPLAAQQGQAVGKAFSQGASANLSFDQFRAKLNGMAAEAAKSGQQAGAAMGSGMAQGLNASEVKRDLKEIGNAAIGAGTALSVGVTAPIVALGVASVAAFGQMDSLMRGLTSIAGSAEGARRQFEELREVAKLPGLGLEEAVQGSIRLQAFGFSAAEAKISMLAFGNAIATVGGGKAELDRVIIQLGQMAGAGKVLTQDLRPIIQTVPQVASIIREQFGPEALGHPAETFEALGISSKEAIAIIVRELGKLPQVTGGIKNDLENFGDAAKIALSGIGEAIAPLVHGFVTVLVPAMNLAVGVFKAMPIPVQALTIGIAGLVALAGPALLLFGGMARGLSEIIGLLNLTAGSAGRAALGMGQFAVATEGAAMAQTQLATSGGIASGAMNTLGKAGLYAAAAFAAWELGNWTAELSIAAQKSENMARGVSLLGDNIKVLDEKLKNGTINLQQYNAALENVGKADRQSMGPSKFSGDVDKIRQSIESARPSIQSLIDQLHEYGIGMVQGRKSNEEFTEALIEMLAKMQATGPATANVNKDIIQLGSGFDSIAGKAKGVKTSVFDLISGYKDLSTGTKSAIEDSVQLQKQYTDAKAVVAELTKVQDGSVARTRALALANADLTKAYEALHPKIELVKGSTADLLKQQNDMWAAYNNAKATVADLLQKQREGKDVALALALANKEVADAFKKISEVIPSVLLPAFDMIAGKSQETRSIFQMIAGDVDKISTSIGNMSVSMENGVRVIRGMKAEHEAAGTAVNGMSSSIENGVKVIRGASVATQSLGDTVAQTGTIFLGASASIKGMTRDALAVSNAWQDLTDTTVKAGSAIAQTMDQVAVNTAWDTGGAHIVDWTSKFAELGEAARQAAGEAALLATSIKNSMDMASGFKASGGFKAGDFSSGDPKYGTTGPAGSGGSGTIVSPEMGGLAPANARAGDIKEIGTLPLGGTGQFNALGLTLWTQEEIDHADKLREAMAKLASEGFEPTLAQATKLIGQMNRTGQTMEEAIAQWKALGEAQSKVAKNTETLKTATKEAAPNVSDLTEQLWRLIDAGQGNTMAAWDLRSQIENLTGSYQAQGVAATASAGASRAAAGAIFNAANLISESVKTVERQTQAARASLGSDLPYVTNPTMASVTSGTMASRASLNQPAAPYYGPTSSAPTPYIPHGPYQPTFDNQPYGTGLGAAPVTIIIPPGSATAIGQSVTQELRNLAGYV